MTYERACRDWIGEETLYGAIVSHSAELVRGNFLLCG